MLYNIIIIKGGNKMSEFENSESNVVQKNNNFISKTFLWMFLGLLATGIISVYTYNSGLLENMV